MRFKKLVPVTTVERPTESRAECDLCKSELLDECGHGDNSVVTIQAKLGDYWPEGDCRTVEELDCCPACWTKIVKPALIALGLQVSTYHAEPGRLESMPFDPALPVPEGGGPAAKAGGMRRGKETFPVDAHAHELAPPVEAFLEPGEWVQSHEASTRHAYHECLRVDIGRRHAAKAAFKFAPGSRARWREYVQTFDTFLEWAQGNPQLVTRELP